MTGQQGGGEIFLQVEAARQRENRLTAGANRLG